MTPQGPKRIGGSIRAELDRLWEAVKQRTPRPNGNQQVSVTTQGFTVTDRKRGGSGPAGAADTTSKIAWAMVAEPVIGSLENYEAVTGSSPYGMLKCHPVIRTAAGYQGILSGGEQFDSSTVIWAKPYATQESDVTVFSDHWYGGRHVHYFKGERIALGELATPILDSRTNTVIRYVDLNQAGKRNDIFTVRVLAEQGSGGMITSCSEPEYEHLWEFAVRTYIGGAGAVSGGYLDKYPYNGQDQDCYNPVAYFSSPNPTKITIEKDAVFTVKLEWGKDLSDAPLSFAQSGSQPFSLAAPVLYSSDPPAFNATNENYLPHFHIISKHQNGQGGKGAP